MTDAMTSEAAVVGSLLIESGLIGKVKAVLRPEHFSDATLGAIYERIGIMSAEGAAVDVVTVADTARSPSERSQIVWLSESVPTALNVEHYANHVIAKYHERKLRDHYAKASADPGDEWAKQAIKETWRSAEEMRVDTSAASAEWVDYTDDIERRAKGDVDYFRSGFPTLDNLTGGGHSRGDVVFFAARPSVGKTSLLTKVALTMAGAGRRVLFLSAEMSKTQIRDRMISQYAGVPLFRVRQPRNEIPKIVSTIGVLQSWPLFVVEGRLRLSRLARLVSAYKPDVVVMDYMQLFSPELTQKADNKTQFLNGVANELKLFARERNVLLIGGVQINRQAESMPNAEPTIAHLKDAGGLEEAADVVVLLHRKNDPPVGGVRQVSFIVAKDRNGACGKFECLFSTETTDFREMAFEDRAVSA
jgi:replicative DNA helicase